MGRCSTFSRRCLALDPRRWPESIAVPLGPSDFGNLDRNLSAARRLRFVAEVECRTMIRMSGS
jgi:hypothetical protein